MSTKALLLSLVLLALILGVFWYLGQNQKKTSVLSTTQQAPTYPPLPTRTKTADCHINGPLPDSACTPGAVFPKVTTAEICTPGYTKSVRNVSQAIKNKVYKEYGITAHRVGQYEVDHLISLELGGSNAVANLWPEAADPRPGYHEKDVVENYLHDAVCSGRMELTTAQHIITTNWLSIYGTITPTSSK